MESVHYGPIPIINKGSNIQNSKNKIMKKLLLGLAVIAMMGAFTSCTRTCTCTATTTNKVIDRDWYDNDDEWIAEVETPTTTTATGQYKGKCSKQNQTATQNNGIIEQTIEVVCK